MRNLIILVLIFSTSAAIAQSSNHQPSQRPTSLNPSSAKPDYFGASKVRKNVNDGPTIETYEQYVARMKRTVKEIEKREKLLKKPQYANPLYFGHKRLPKKHKAGKLKFCKECGIRH
jgi:hypothetical protein